jgi:hypothetical protein
MTIRTPLLRTLTAVALAGTLTLAACDSEPVDPPNEGELITEVTITLTNTASAADAHTITASDPDGDGAGITFSPTSVTLRPGATYSGAITLRNTIDNEDITEEIAGDESEEHLFRYTFNPATFGAVTLTDRESQYTTQNTNGGDYAVGLAFSAVLADGITGSGTLNARLYHFDEGPKTSSTATSDEIDIDIDFPVTIAPPTAAPQAPLARR